MKKCSIDGCDRQASSRGLCGKHYTRAYMRGEFGDIARRDPPNMKPPDICTIDGCEKPHFARGYCSAHYTRMRRHGDPLGGGTPQGEPMEWLLSHLDYDSDKCLIWPYATAKGYGMISFNGRQRVASNLMCELVNGKPPPGKPEAAHSCGRGHEGCVNPNHLYWASHAENHQDKKKHGTTLLGTNHPMAKLSESEVRQIRSAHGSVRADDLAEQFNVSRSHIYLIWTRKLWRHI